MKIKASAISCDAGVCHHGSPILNHELHNHISADQRFYESVTIYFKPR